MFNINPIPEQYFPYHILKVFKLYKNAFWRRKTIFFNFLLPKKEQFFHFFFEVLSVFDAKWFQINTLSAPLKLISTPSFTKIQLAPISSISRHSNEAIKSLF